MHNYFLQAFEWAIENPTSPVLGVVAVAWWLFQKRFERRWAADLEGVKTALQTELERAKAAMQRDHATLLAQHQRELEAYKVSLIAEAERSRATQDIAKAIALKVGERRFAAIADFHDAMAGYDIEVCAFARTAFPSREDFHGGLSKIVDRETEFLKAAIKAAPFVSVEVSDAANSLLQCAHDLYELRLSFDRPLVEDTHGAMTSCEAAGAKLDLLIRAVLSSYERMMHAT